MSLEEYTRKRDFSKTPEPEPEEKVEQENIFVVQEHHARRLHYDLRLAMGGVLKSWAIPKPPPAERGVRRLAIQTEDHPLEYADFEGVIPEGMYGAGKVKIWDRGTYEVESIKEEKMVFRLKGEKLRGRYVLLRFKKGGENAWLFFRAKEEKK
jgi:DNA ligase D-like protein (predicted 3'-phosphoesterase)